jgi:hypothetical protein
MKYPKVCPDAGSERLSGFIVPPLSGQAEVETGEGVPACGGGTISVEWNGAARGVIVGLGMAVAIRARLRGRPAMAQDANARQAAAEKKQRRNQRMESFIESTMMRGGKKFQLSSGRLV